MNDPAFVALLVGTLSGGLLSIWGLSFGVTRITEFFTSIA